MPNPKHRFSKTRTATRRSTKKAGIPTLSTDSHSGELHMRHRAHQVGDELIYRGQVVYTKAKPE